MKTKPLYFDYQSTTPICEEALRQMEPYFAKAFANPHATTHTLGLDAAASVQKATQQIAQLIGASADEIIFTSGATESNNLAILGLAKRAIRAYPHRKRILLSAIEHKCVLSLGRVLQEQHGYTVDTIPVDQYGQVIPTQLERLLGDDVLLVSIMAVNNEIGSIQDIKALSEIISQTDAIFHCDAGQAPMAMPIDGLAELANMISLSGHKMYGPKGIGALYVQGDLQNSIEPLIYGGGQQRGLRSGTLPTPLCVGMGAAAAYIGSRDVAQKREELQRRRDRFLDKLLALPWRGLVYGDRVAKRHPGNIAIGFQGFHGDDVLGVLQPHLAASTGAACTSGTPEPSHVLRAIGLTMTQAETVIRLSLGFETSDEDIDGAVALIASGLQQLTD